MCACSSETGGECMLCPAGQRCPKSESNGPHLALLLRVAALHDGHHYAALAVRLILFGHQGRAPSWQRGMHGAARDGRVECGGPAGALVGMCMGMEGKKPRADCAVGHGRWDSRLNPPDGPSPSPKTMPRGRGSTATTIWLRGLQVSVKLELGAMYLKACSTAACCRISGACMLRGCDLGA